MTDASASNKRYQTKQKELVLACLRQSDGSFITAKRVVELLTAQGRTIGTATVYRNLERLEADGIVVRSTVEGTGGTCYRYLEPTAEEPQDACFYLKCESCGQLIPVDCAELGSFYEHFAREHHIRIDPVKTVLYGTCPACLDACDGEVDAGTADGKAVPNGEGCSCCRCHAHGTQPEHG